MMLDQGYYKIFEAGEDKEEMLVHEGMYEQNVSCLCSRFYCVDAACDSGSILWSTLDSCYS